ncbi:XRE family transcriptional regulator [Tsukamurella sp. 8F]|uniref:helix-turn-helix domain-containing protein n=1 Tax=unclassified Tsukamurella TaxID=2633480 RepID=UPI0023B94B83|nr:MULTISPECIES: XRE family transcriptional regulator [unclassified Tsukamurella]MDF0528785.1 XRE family transcriptional regulator [Tsukamurella sp. 8J]MDF0586620.1 XRE family transcriptional regulator [Tsukamurella sp. 8F]
MVAMGDVRIGEVLKAARLARRRTLADVAREVDITKGYLSKLERDTVSASVATLVKLCAALDIPMGSLFEGPSVGDVVRSGAYPPIAFGGDGVREFLLTTGGERRLQTILSEIVPGGGSGDEAYALPADVAFAFVLDGVLDIAFTGAATVQLSAGDGFTFDPRRRHTFRAGPDGARVLWSLAPALPDETRY